MMLIDQFGQPLPSATYAQPGSSGYEGAQTTDVRDSFVAFPTNSRRELNSYTRKELQRKVRALSANLPLFDRINTKIGQHAVGKGIFVRPLTLDKEWNLLNRKRYENRVKQPFLYSIDGSRDLYEDQRQAAQSMCGDGEFFEAFVQGEEGAPFVQPLDPFEVETPRELQELRRDARWQDGILSNAFDRPIAYGIRELALGDRWYFRDEKTREIPADKMVHIFRRKRAHQPRGIPWACTGVNDGIDVLDLKALIKGKAKLHSALAIAVRKKAAEAGEKGLGDRLQKLLGADGKLTQVNENFWKGASIQYLAADEGIDLLSSDCPGEPLMAFMEFLERQIACGYGVSYESVVNLAAAGGTATRAILEDLQWTCEMVQDTTVMRHSQRHYIWDTAMAVKAGKIRECRDPEWWAAAWRGPAKLTVDLGRTADAAIKLIKNGALSHVRYYEERAQDAYEEAEEQIQFLAWLKTRAAEAGIPIEMLIEPTPGAVNNISVHANPTE